MEHTDAIQTQAVERYLLGEMTEDEQEIFEVHFFDCRVCAADVTDGTRMMIAGKAVVQEERAAEERARLANVVPMPKPKPWFPVAAAASLILPLLGGGVGYQLAEWHRRPEPTRLVNVVFLDTGVSRGTADEVTAVQPGDDLRFEVDSKDEATRYVAVVSCGGKTESTHGISRAMAADAVTLRLGELPAGRCELVVQGVRKDGNRFRITSSPFEVGER